MSQRDLSMTDYELAQGLGLTAFVAGLASGLTSLGWSTPLIPAVSSLLVVAGIIVFCWDGSNEPNQDIDDDDLHPAALVATAVVLAGAALYPVAWLLEFPFAEVAVISTAFIVVGLGLQAAVDHYVDPDRDLTLDLDLDQTFDRHTDRGQIDLTQTVPDDPTAILDEESDANTETDSDSDTDTGPE